MDTNKKQLEDINIDKISNIIQSENPEYFNNILIDKNQEVLRANYIFYDFDSMVVHRTVQRVKVPLYSDIERDFENLIPASKGEGIKFIKDETCKTFKKQGEYESDENPKDSTYLEYDIEVENGIPKSKQSSYYFSDETYIQECGECNGDKYVPCQDSECSGRHVWTCTDCHGKKQVQCDGCYGDGKIECSDCKGDGKVKCGSWAGSGLVGSLGSTSAGCNGKGLIYVTKPGTKTDQKIQKKCSKCRGRGEVTCSNCTKGLIICSTCDGKKKIDCRTCSAKGDITCDECHGNGLTKKDFKYGKIDCPSCDATGKFGFITFVETSVEKIADSKLSTLDHKIDELSDDEIKKHIDSNYSKTNTLININSDFKENLGDVEKGFINQIRSDNEIFVNSYRKSVKEELFCAVVPAIRIKYKHIISNTEHYLAVVNPFVNPKLVFFSVPKEASKATGFKKIIGQLGNFFSKVAKTKSYKARQDKILEILLMIRLMKADGRIDEGEKSFMIDEIGTIEGLINKEKDYLFDFLSKPSLPELNVLDVKFSSKERFKKCIETLNKMAESDGEVDDTELEMIKKTTQLYGTLDKK